MNPQGDPVSNKAKALAFKVAGTFAFAVAAAVVAYPQLEQLATRRWS